MPVPYQRHGRRHAADGEDPIPTTAAATSAMWPMSQDMMPWDAVKRGQDGVSTWTPTRDSAYLGGFYSEASALNAEVIMYFRLGPRGSAWGINIEADKGSDCGQFTVSWQVIDEDCGALGNGAGFEDGIGLIKDSYAATLPTFYVAGAGSSQDLYAAAPSLHQNFDGIAQFRIMGQPGDVCTSDSTVNADDPFFEHFDGGPGIWACKIEITGQNASSSGYRVRLENAIIRRWTVGGYPTG